MRCLFVSIFQSYEELLNKTVNNPITNNDKQVRLFYPTTIQYLNLLLNNGIRTNMDSLELEEKVISLTNKWHYFETFNQANLFSLERHGEGALTSSKTQWWTTFETMPCYLELHIPTSVLLPDLSYLNSNYFKKQVRLNTSHERVLKWEDSLSQHGKVAVPFGIPREWIVAFTILPDIEFFFKHITSKDSQYMKDYLNWKEGKGIGKVKMKEMLEWEKDFSYNSTWYMEGFPKYFFIDEFQVNEDKRKMFLNITKL